MKLSLEMALHKLISQSGIYFITFTCYKWISLIELVGGYDLFYKWFDFLKNKGHSICGFVIMPNHIHLLLHFVESGQMLNKLVGNGKRFMAYELIERLKSNSHNDILVKLRHGVRNKDRSRGKLHEVWEKSFDLKECRTEKFTLQKLIYIHNNPCAKKWNLCTEPHHYLHSSALFYFNGKTSAYPVDDYRDFLGRYDIESFTF
jgi:REP element-mobilizing transposase RayT